MSLPIRSRHRIGRPTNLSRDLSAAEKKTIAKAARDALYDENWRKILW